uniref:Uncharacterized protein n=1 Tax=Anguilla anguilla TaxID=7936 RepID=A0A0E9XWA4_ANGAN
MLLANMLHNSYIFQLKKKFIYSF